MLSFFPRGFLAEILNLIESVSEGFSSYSYIKIVNIRYAIASKLKPFFTKEEK